MNNFDYKKYLKEGKLFEDFPKGKWVDLDDIEQSEYAENIFDLIKTAYASIGGHSNYQSSTDVVGSEGDADYEVINLDDDPDIEAELKKSGHFIEVSGRIKDILLGKGVPMVTDEETIRRALKGKEIEMNDDGSYQRKIAGKAYTKVLLGKPL